MIMTEEEIMGTVGGRKVGRDAGTLSGNAETKETVVSL